MKLFSKRKKAPEQEKSSRLVKWINNNRGKLALCFGLWIGVNDAKMIRGCASGVFLISHSVSAVLGGDKETKSAEPFQRTPNICDLETEAFFSKSHLFQEDCEWLNQNASCDLVRRAEQYEDGIALVMAEDIVDEEIQSPKGQCGLEVLETESAMSLENYEPFEALPFSFKQVLQNYDPVIYEKIKNRIHIKWSTTDNAHGTAEGPVRIICDGTEYIPSPKGQDYLIEMDGHLPGIDFLDAMAARDEKAIRQYAKLFAILGHELYGHTINAIINPEMRMAFRGKSSDEICGKEGIPQMVEDEIYSYYQGFQLLKYLSDTYPVIGEMLWDEINDSEAKKMTNFCSMSVDEFQEYKKETFILPYGFELYEAFLEAMETGDWLQFKEHVIIRVANYQFGLPYLIERSKGTKLEGDCYYGLNQNIEALLTSDSPEKIVQK